MAPVLIYEGPTTEEDDGLASLFAIVQSDFVVSSAKALQLDAVPTRLYPNPAKDHVQIDFELDRATNNFTVFFYDLNGKLVKRTPPVDLPKGYHNLRLDWKQDLAKGMYLLEMRGQGVLVRKKVVVH